MNLVDADDVSQNKAVEAMHRLDRRYQKQIKCNDAMQTYTLSPTEVINRDTYDAFRHGDKTEATADKKTDTDVTKAKIDYKEGTEHFESKEWVKGTQRSIAGYG